MGKFKIGDSVCLKTDRTETMTVNGFERSEPQPIISGTDVIGEKPGIVDESQVVCVWHDKAGRPQERTYHEDALELFHRGIPAPIYHR